MRRCTLLPITDSVGGAIGFKVFEEIEKKLKRSNWCTYVSNSGLISVFSKYRENLPQHLKSKPVLSAVADKLKVGSLIRIGIINEVSGVEVQTEVYGENGEDIYFSEKIVLDTDDIDIISSTVNNWLNLYAKMIPYDAKVNGILGDQITLDVGKGYPITVGQKFVVKRLVAKKVHPLLNKIVDWNTEILAEGSVFSISDNQALGMVKVYKQDKKLAAGDWVRLEEKPQGGIEELIEAKVDDHPGELGIFSMSMFASNSSIDTSTLNGSQRMGGNYFGIDARVEAWITRQYFAAFEVVRAIGSLKKTQGAPVKDAVNATMGTFKLSGGYKYLPIGFFYGPQIDLFGGYTNHTYDLETSTPDGFGSHTFSGLTVGTAANIPINREFRFFVQAEFLPFPSFADDDGLYGTAKNVTVMELEMGIKYHYTQRITLDGSIESVSRKAKFDRIYKEVSYKDNMFKLGASFNF
ncbi:MAG TPA: hypothetical protein VNJ08_09120 [Bacteriovoracaceae bacterium]|nr:hypothetical protein [Bacteriovoracaceae bacterium]